MKKVELRDIYLKKRILLSESEYALLNFQVCQNFFSSVDLSFANVIHTFLPLKENKEPDTWLITERIQKEFPHIRISLPRVNVKTGNLENFFYEGLHQLQKNKWGIAEPQEGLPTASTSIDMVLVPLLIFDHQGNRVGYGKGFYDKFLAECPPSCVRVGLSFFDPVDKITDINIHDQPLSIVITPTMKYEF